MLLTIRARTQASKSEYGMSGEQIAGELKTTTKRVASLAAHLISTE
jgi:hypothetical protein